MSTASGEILGDLSKRLEVAADDGVDERAGVVGGVSRRDVDYVGLDDDGAGTGGRRVESGDGAVVGEAVVAADDAEADDVALVVEDLQALGAVVGGEAGDDLDLAEGADGAVADDDVTAL